MQVAIIVGYFLLALIDVFLIQVDYRLAVQEFSFFILQIAKN